MSSRQTDSDVAHEKVEALLGFADAEVWTTSRVSWRMGTLIIVASFESAESNTKQNKIGIKRSEDYFLGRYFQWNHFIQLAFFMCRTVRSIYNVV